MGNFFDQFDAGPAGTNYFDQFDAPEEPKMNVKALEWASQPGVVRKFKAEQEQLHGTAEGAEPSLAGDAAASLGSGVLRGAAETAMAPVTVKRMMEGGVDWAMRKGDGLVRTIFGGSPLSDEEWNARLQQSRPAYGIDRAVNGVQDQTRQQMNAGLYAPRTTTGKYADAVGQLIPGAAMMATRAPSLMSGAAQLVGDAVAPGLASEAAGQMTEGTAMEPWARAAGAFAGNLGAAGARSYLPSADHAVARAAATVTPQQFQAAQDLQARAAAFGVPLTGPEALSQVTSGATRLPDLLRVVENAPGGGGATGAFFAQRPQQVQAAVGRVLDAVAPQDANPVTLGPRVAEAAQGALEGVRRDINRHTRPLYQAAEPQIVNSPAVDAATAAPAYVASLQRLRNDPVLGPQYAHLPDNSVAVIDAVTKDMQAQGRTLANSSVAGFNPERAAAYNSGAADARSIARDPAQGGVQAYDDALTQQASLRATQLEPLEQGTLGSLSKAGSTRQAYEAVMPRQPLVGGAQEIGDALTRIIMSDPNAPVGALVRQGMADVFDQAGRRLQGGLNQYAGAGYAKAIGGTDQQRENLRAALGALPSGGASVPSLDNALDVLAATGTRAPKGSATAFNSMFQDELSAPGVVGALATGVKTGGLSFLRNAGDAARRAAFGRGLNDLAELFVSPESVQRIQAIAERGTANPLVQAITRSGIQAPIVVQNAQ